MNESLTLAVYLLIEERLRRQGIQGAERDEIAAAATAEFFARNPEIFWTVMTGSSLAALVVNFSKQPTKKAKHEYYRAKKRRESRVQTIDLRLPENDRFYDAKNSPALIAEQKDALAAIQTYAEELGPYRGISRFRLTLAKFGAESFTDLAAELNVGADAVRRAANATFDHCQRRLGIVA